MCDKSREELTEEQLARIKDFEKHSGLGILTYRELDDRVVPTLINGRQVDRKDYQEVVRIGNRSCTGTVVGPNCVITAAHCGRNNSRSNIELYDGRRVNARMVHHNRYRNSSNYDVAVLVLDSEIDIKPAKVGIDHRFVVGQDVDILGYGCTRIGGGGGNDGILRFGESKVSGFTGTDVITQWRPGGAALCFGDSGGPMMKDLSDASPDDINTLIAVNSKGNIRDTNYNLRLDLDSVVEWLKAMADRFDLQMWGVNVNPDPPGPDPDPEPNPDPQPGVGLVPVWSNTAKDHRSIAENHISIAEKYEALAEEGSGGSSAGGGDSGNLGSDISEGDLIGGLPAL